MYTIELTCQFTCCTKWLMNGKIQSLKAANCFFTLSTQHHSNCTHTPFLRIVRIIIQHHTWESKYDTASGI